MNRPCEQHNTEIALLKQMSGVYEKELDEIKAQLNNNNIIVITSLVSTILCLIGIFGLIIEKFM